jgi:hypothetical protein
VSERLLVRFLGQHPALQDGFDKSGPATRAALPAAISATRSSDRNVDGPAAAALPAAAGCRPGILCRPETRSCR